MSWKMNEGYANMGQKLKQNVNNQYRKPFESTPNMPNNKSKLNKKMEEMFEAQENNAASRANGNFTNFSNGNFSNWSNVNNVNNVNNDNVNEEKYELNAPTAAAWNRAHRGNVPEVTLSRRHVPFTKAPKSTKTLRSRSAKNVPKALNKFKAKYSKQSGKIPAKINTRYLKIIQSHRNKRRAMRKSQKNAPKLHTIINNENNNWVHV